MLSTLKASGTSTSLTFDQPFRHLGRQKVELVLHHY